MAIIANLFIDQGTDFTVTVDVSDATGGILDLTGYSASAVLESSMELERNTDLLWVVKKLSKSC